jgi:hypothetical protein
MDHVESDLICQNGHDYTFLDYAPLLCDFCDEPLTLTMDAVADLKQSAAGTSQLTDKALIHTHQRLVDSNTNQLVFPTLQQVPQYALNLPRRR